MRSVLPCFFRGWFLNEIIQIQVRAVEVDLEVDGNAAVVVPQGIKDVQVREADFNNAREHLTVFRVLRDADAGFATGLRAFLDGGGQSIEAGGGQLVE